MSVLSGHQWLPLEGEELERQRKDWSGYSKPMVRLSPGRWLFPQHYLRFADKIYNFKFRPSDVVVMTYSKCGTTWTQEIVWTMRNNPNLDHPEADRSVLVRSPFLDMDMFLDGNLAGIDVDNHPMFKYFKTICPGKDHNDGMMLQMAEDIPDPRTIKTHLPFSLLPPSLLDTTKVVYVARNPKDVVISYHHHCCIARVMGYQGSFEEFVQYFVDDNLAYGPYWLHLKEAWEKRHHPNLHLIFFEDLKKDNMGELRKLNTFLNTGLSEEQLSNIGKYTSFSEMKARDALFSKTNESYAGFNSEVVKSEGGFFRKGEVGDWKRKLTPEMEAKVDKWMADNLSGLGVSFKYS